VVASPKRKTIAMAITMPSLRSAERIPVDVFTDADLQKKAGYSSGLTSGCEV